MQSNCPIVLQVSILFEVENLSQASPATVSRAGMVYLNVEDLGWRASFISWLDAMAEATTVKDALRDMVDRCAGLSAKELWCDARQDVSSAQDVAMLAGVLNGCTLE